MSRTVPALIVVAAVVAALVASPLAVAAGVGGGFAQTTADEPNGTDAGARLAGVVGSEGAEIEGDLQERSFAAAFGNASSDEAKAAVVADAHGSLSERLADLRERKASITDRYENGSMARGEYRARLARLSAQISTLTSMANRTSDAARDLPDAALDARGVNVTALDELRRNAANLSGPEVAAAARNLTRGGPPAGVGPNGTPGGGPGSTPGGGPDGTPGAGPGAQTGTERPGQGPPEDVNGENRTTGRQGTDARTDRADQGRPTEAGPPGTDTARPGTDRGQAGTERPATERGQASTERPATDRSERRPTDTTAEPRGTESRTERSQRPTTGGNRGTSEETTTERRRGGETATPAR